MSIEHTYWELCLYYREAGEKKKYKYHLAKMVECLNNYQPIANDATLKHYIYAAEVYLQFNLVKEYNRMKILAHRAILG